MNAPSTLNTIYVVEKQTLFIEIAQALSFSTPKSLAFQILQLSSCLIIRESALLNLMATLIFIWQCRS